ncbi:hypothetical protein FRX31_020332, partial [Thalictrum thalictroides]
MKNKGNNLEPEINDTNFLTDDFGKFKKCSLKLNSEGEIVAEGKVYVRIGLDEVVHFKPLGSDNVIVYIEHVHDLFKESSLPEVATGILETVNDALNILVAWPSKLVIEKVDVGEE